MNAFQIVKEDLKRLGMTEELLEETGLVGLNQFVPFCLKKKKPIFDTGVFETQHVKYLKTWRSHNGRQMERGCKPDL